MFINYKIFILYFLTLNWHVFDNYIGVHNQKTKTTLFNNQILSCLSNKISRYLVLRSYPQWPYFSSTVVQNKERLRKSYMKNRTNKNNNRFESRYVTILISETKQKKKRQTWSSDKGRRSPQPKKLCTGVSGSKFGLFKTSTPYKDGS